MKFDHVAVSLPKDATYYAVEILEESGKPLKLDTVWKSKEEAIKRGVEVYAMVNRCMLISTIEGGEFTNTELL